MENNTLRKKEIHTISVFIKSGEPLDDTRFGENGRFSTNSNATAKSLLGYLIVYLISVFIVLLYWKQGSLLLSRQIMFLMLGIIAGHLSYFVFQKEALKSIIMEHFF